MDNPKHATLWEIETRILELQHELEHLHQEKARLLSITYSDELSYTCT